MYNVSGLHELWHCCDWVTDRRAATFTLTHIIAVLITVTYYHIHIARVSETLRVEHYFFPNVGRILTKVGRKMGHGTVNPGV